MTKARAYISFGLVIASVGATLSFAVMITSVPEQARLWQFGALYLGVFGFTFGVTLAFGYLLRCALWPRGNRHDFALSARRQSVLFGIMTVVVLILESAQVFNFWSGALLFAIFVLIELYVQ